VEIVSWLVVLVFLGTIAYIPIGMILAVVEDERDRKRRAREAEERRRALFG
jgi:hypothetical protein